MHRRTWSVALLVLATACTSDDDQPGADTATAGSQTGGTGGEVSSTGGGAGDSSGSGGSTAGGGNGGGSGSKGGSGGVSTGGASGAGGASGGAGGGGGATQIDAGAGTPVPSAGCAKATARPASGEVTVADQYILTFPPTYDGKTPMPVVFGFHGANRTNVDFRGNDAATQGGDFEKNYVMAYVKSVGTDWTSQLQPNFARFDAVYDELANNRCIDTSRVFAMGHSSGAQFCSQLVCRPEPRLRGIAPVASSPYGGNCRQIPVLIIHGKTDSARGNDGSAYVQQFVTRNGCMNTTTPYPVAMCNSIAGGMSVTPGCVQYQGCGKNPTIWCSHNDPNYSGTNHGWPCFANKTIIEFFNGLR